LKLKHILYLSICIVLTTASLEGNVNKNRNSFSGFNKGYFSGSYNLYPTFVSVINSDVAGFGTDELDEELYLTGFELCGNMNPAFGVGVHYYFGGDETRKIVEVDFEGSPVELDRLVKYDVSFFGLNVNYRKSLIGRLEFNGGLSFSYGGIKLLISQDAGNQSYEDLWGSFDPESELDKRFNKSTIYQTPLFVFRSDNGLKLFISDRIAVGLNAGYVYALASDNGDVNYGFETLKNVPSLDFDGWTFGATIYLGY
jgi:hypothetical protein